MTWAASGQIVSPNAFHDFPAGTFDDGGSYEWQVRTYDAQGVVGPWSASGFFASATAPSGPTITAPINGSTVSSTATVTWSFPDQTAYQVRRVADNAGAADTATVYYDSGQVADATRRSIDLTFDTNNRYEHVQVRIESAGLWSSWADIYVQVSYAAPAVPAVTTMDDSPNGVMVVGINNPAPSGGEPEVAYNNVWIDDADGKGLVRKATNLPTNKPWTYWTPPSGFDGATVGVLQVEAVATNDTRSWSAAPTPGVVYEDLDGGTATTAGADFLDGGSI